MFNQLKLYVRPYDRIRFNRPESVRGHFRAWPHQRRRQRTQPGPVASGATVSDL